MKNNWHRFFPGLARRVPERRTRKINCEDNRAERIKRKTKNIN
jgi:hypothetical protein